MKILYVAVLMALSIFLALCVVSFADSFTVNGYSIDVIVSTQPGGTIQALGRVDGGPPCKGLLVEVDAQNENGDIAYVSGSVDDVGSGGGRVLNARDKWYGGDTIWKILNVNTSCLQEN